MAHTRNKQITLSTRERVMQLKKLLEDAIRLKYDPKLIKNYKKQLKEQEEILKKDKEKRENNQNEVKR